MPPFIIRKQKYFLAYYLIWLPYSLAYLLTNRFPLFTPVELPLTALDRAIPFLPFLIPVYVSYLLYAPLVVSRSQNDREVTELFYLSHLQLGICLCFFLLFPVTYPRESFYYANGWTHLFNQFWTWLDAPNNCFPSLHTANCCLTIHYSQNKENRVLYTLWGLLIIAGTLVCKQHYFIDVLAGILVYGIAKTLFGAWMKKW
ncbi:MAG TPA: phosphatase PAP2 family protein [Smithellaceae bacterium]|jgi:membrane-associated phospholipid phosphatase|nr:phosphatase PAP2 family protein [Smithellaceae bacterium]